MTHERAGRLQAFLPSEGEVIMQQGIEGMRKSVQGRKLDGPYAGTYTLHEIALQAPESMLTRHELTLHRDFDGKELSAVILNGFVTSVSGFGENLTEAEKMLYAKHLFHNFATCEEFMPPLVTSE